MKLTEVEYKKIHLRDIDCLILAGGRGTRIKDLLPSGTPKFLAPINGKPFADYLLYSLIDQGLRNFIFALHYKKETIVKYLDGCQERRNRPGLFGLIQSIHWTWWPQQIDRKEAIKRAMEQKFTSSNVLRSNPIIIINGDTLLNISLDNCLTIFEDNKLESAAIWCNNELELQTSISRSEYYHCGVDFYTQTALNNLPSDNQTSIIKTPGSFLDIGTPIGYALAKRICPR